MTTSVTVTELSSHQLKAAASLLAAAFFNYPMFTFYFPDPQRRARYLPWYLRNVLNCAFRYGDVYTTPEVSGVIFTLPPGHTKISLWEYVQNGFLLTPLLLGLQNYKRSMDCEDFVGRTQTRLMQDRPHYYLWGLAVDPARKSKGIGTALMQPVLEKADADKMPIYLETHDERNASYYQRHSFDLIHTVNIPKYDLPIWCMLREPR